MRSLLVLSVVLWIPISVQAEGNRMLKKLSKILGYAEQLQNAITEEHETDRLKVTAGVITDTYVFQMARGIEEIHKAGYDEDKVWKELEELHKKHKSSKGKYLFFVDLESLSGHHLCRKGKKLFYLRQRSEKSLKVKGQKPKLEFLKWQVFQYPPNDSRKIGTHTLARFSKVRFYLTSSSFKRKNAKDPFSLQVGNLWYQEERMNPTNSINLNEQQISCSKLKDLEVPVTKLKFYPGRWEIPKVPSELQDILDTLETK